MEYIQEKVSTGVRCFTQSSKWALRITGVKMYSLYNLMVVYFIGTHQQVSSNLASTTCTGSTDKSRFMLVSGDDRHVICFGTETTIGTTSTQDNMFIRWSSQESTSDGHQRQLIQQGSKTKRLTDGNQIQTAVRSRGAVWYGQILLCIQCSLLVHLLLLVLNK